MSNYIRLSSQGDSITVGGAGTMVLRGINVNTGVASTSVRIYEGTASPSASSRLIGVFSGTAQGNLMNLNLEVRNGFRAEALGGNPDAIVIYD
jgi:hypothetical protein